MIQSPGGWASLAAGMRDHPRPARPRLKRYLGDPGSVAMTIIRSLRRSSIDS